MQIILIKDVDKIGKMGDIVKVKDGYGTNFLIPRNLAKRITRKSKGFIEDEKKKGTLKLKRVKDQAEKIKEKLENMSCTIPVAAGEDEKLFGSVTAEMISSAYKQEGMDIEKKQIQIGEHINKLGTYNVDIKLHPEVTANTRVWVVKK
ncbi:MAG: 50S ribosomal protein L9 [Candidatus Omnitrophica bacterium]|nr:50S ribosomal protein L9 [Candidatus Omnitrophota bacterium]